MVRQAEAIALLAPARAPLTYGRLWQHVDEGGRRLQAHGLRHEDCIAVVLPPGPELALACLTVASSAVCAPLNPAYRAAEYEFYLDDLHARALLIQADCDSPARAVAQARGLRILEVTPCYEDAAGVFSLPAVPPVPGAPQCFAGPADQALLLHTSGTTAQPKLVPLTHANICTAAANIAATLALEPGDRCLNVMPLFHIHGLVAGILASLLAGASVVCPPGFAVP